MSPRHLLTLALLAAPALSPALYLSVTKDHFFNQLLYGTPSPSEFEPFYFLCDAEDFNRYGITDVALTAPGGSPFALTVDNNKPAYFTFSDSSADPANFAAGGLYPNGTYTFGLTPSQPGLNLTLSLTGNNYPDAPAHADPYNADAYDASKAITVKLLPYLGSTADDLVYASILDADGVFLESLPDPAFNATSLTIPADTLSPGTTYFLAVSYYKAKTLFESADGLFLKESYYSSSTYIEIATLPANAVYLPAQPLPDGRGGTSYTGTVTGVTGTGPFTYSLAAGSLPPGLTLGPSTGTIAGTIATHAANTEYAFSIRAANGTGSYSAPFVIPVRANGSGGTPPVQEFGFLKLRSNTQAKTSAAPVADANAGHQVDIFANGFSARGLGDASIAFPVTTNFAARSRHLQRTFPLDGELVLFEYADSLAELNTSFPASASYTFNFNARTTGTSTFSSTLNSGADSYPAAPVFTGSLPATVDPDSVLPVAWTLWTTGKAGTEQFIEFSVIDSGTGEEVFNTDAPWDTSPTAIKLAATATGTSIPAGTLEEGKNYELKLTFHNILTKTNMAVSGFNSALGLVGRSTITYLPVSTAPAQATLSSWAASNALPAGGDSFASDPDADGLSNLMEYAFLGAPNEGADPLATEFDLLTDPALTAAAPVKPGPVVTTDAVNSVVTIRHPLRTNATDLTYSYQTSPDCVTWSTVIPISRAVIYGDDTRELVDVVLPLTPAVGKTQVFVRLKVEFTEPVGAP